MKKSGRPISEDDRRRRNIEHLLHYGVKMMVRRDIGGSAKISEHPKILTLMLRGKTAIEGGELTAKVIDKVVKGITERQSRTLEEVGRRIQNLRLVFDDLEPNDDPLYNVVELLLNGEEVKVEDLHVLK